MSTVAAVKNKEHLDDPLQIPRMFFKADPAGGFTVTFRDVPEAITQGDTRKEAESMAVDALVTAMNFYIEQNRAFPQPSPVRSGETPIPMPACISDRGA